MYKVIIVILQFVCYSLEWHERLFGPYLNQTPPKKETGLAASLSTLAGLKCSKTKLRSPTNEKCELSLWDYFTLGYFLSGLKGNRHIRAYNMRKNAHLMSYERQISCPFKTPKIHFHSITSNSELPKSAATDQPTPTPVPSGRRYL